MGELRDGAANCQAHDAANSATEDLARAPSVSVCEIARKVGGIRWNASVRV